MNKIERIRQFVADDDLTKAIVEIKEFAKTNPIFDTLLVQEGSLKELERKILNGTIDSKDAFVRKNEIRESLLKITRILEEDASKNIKIDTINTDESVNYRFELNKWIKTSGANILVFLLGLAILFFFINHLGYLSQNDTSWIDISDMMLKRKNPEELGFRWHHENYVKGDCKVEYSDHLCKEIISHPNQSSNYFGEGRLFYRLISKKQRSLFHEFDTDPAMEQIKDKEGKWIRKDGEYFIYKYYSYLVRFRGSHINLRLDHEYEEPYYYYEIKFEKKY